MSTMSELDAARRGLVPLTLAQRVAIQRIAQRDGLVAALRAAKAVAA